MKKILYSFLVFFLFFLINCNKNEDLKPYDRQETVTTEVTATLISDDFAYNTTNSVELEVNFQTSENTPLTNVYIEVYTENPENEDGIFNEEIVPAFKGITGESGKLTTQFSIPTYVETLYVCPQFIGVVNKIEIPLTSKKNTVKVSRNLLKSGNSTNNVKGEILGMITLGTWNSLGVPDYICGQDVISTDFFKKITSNLPERKNLPVEKPILFNDNVNTNIILQDKGEVYITFLHEGAGWKNTFGYYTYEVGNEPATVADITNFTIIFPNSSYKNSGGGLFSGDKVCLGEFPKNTVIAWFVIAQGWNNDVTNGAYKIFSDKWLNPETDASLKQHSVLLKDPQSARYVIAFEDINREKSSCDNDFNDIVFYATVTPDDAVLDDDIIVIDDYDDTDGDGVTDLNDDYPNDEELAFDNISDWSTLVYEDLWPSKGDYDFNDLVLFYQVNQISNSQNLVVYINSQLSIRAIGAGFHNGFAIQFPVNYNVVEFVTGTEFTDSSYFNLNSNGTEANQTTAVIPIFDDAYHAFNNKGMINVHVNQTFVQPDTMQVQIKFSVPQTFGSLGGLPFNPFIIKNGVRSIEIHLPNKMPTDLMDLTKFGTGDDSSDVSAGRTYLTSDNKPWGLNIAGEFYHPYEKNIISSGYLMYDQWATSNGVLYPDWYLDIEGYRDNTKLYPNP